MAGPRKTDVLNRRKERALGAVLVEPTLERAAKAAHVGVRSLRRWLRDDPVFITAYQEARRECVRRTTGLLQQKASEAVEVLAALMSDQGISPSVRSSSASRLLEIAHRATEADVQGRMRELERKLSEIEALLVGRATELEAGSMSPSFGR